MFLQTSTSISFASQIYFCNNHVLKFFFAECSLKKYHECAKKYAENIHTTKYDSKNAQKYTAFPSKISLTSYTEISFLNFVQLNWCCDYTYPIVWTPNEIPFSDKFIGKVYLQSKFGLIWWVFKEYFSAKNSNTEIIGFSNTFIWIAKKTWMINYSSPAYNFCIIIQTGKIIINCYMWSDWSPIEGPLKLLDTIVLWCSRRASVGVSIGAERRQSLRKLYAW